MKSLRVHLSGRIGDLLKTMKCFQKGVYFGSARCESRKGSYQSKLMLTMRLIARAVDEKHPDASIWRNLEKNVCILYPSLLFQMIPLSLRMSGIICGFHAIRDGMDLFFWPT